MEKKNQMVNTFRKELIKKFLTANIPENSFPIRVSLSFHTYSNTCTVTFVVSEQDVHSTSIGGGLEMTSEIANEVMFSLGFTKIGNPYTGYGEAELHLYRMD